MRAATSRVAIAVAMAILAVIAGSSLAAAASDYTPRAHPRPPVPVSSEQPDLPHGPVARGDVTIPWWQGSFQYQGQTYSYRMVGTDPAAGSATTTVPTVIVPLRLVFASDGGVMQDDAMAADLASSPIFQPSQTRTAYTQFGDAIQRESLWGTVSTVAPDWHVLLGGPQVLPTVTIDVPADNGVTRFDAPSSRPIALIELNWLDQRLQQLVASLGIPPTTLPAFAAYNTYAAVKGTDIPSCFDRLDCPFIGGYHSDEVVGGGRAGAHAVHTYMYATYEDFGTAVPPDYPSSGAFTLSHEVLEWLADPFADNVVPPWSFPNVPSACGGDLLEVADPVNLVGFVLPGAPDYLVTDAVYLPWFTREQPSSAWGGRYDILNFTSGPSIPCVSP